MKITFHGFIAINALIDNARYKVSPIGELSAVGRTYSSDVTSHTKDEYPDVRLLGFRCEIDESLEPIPATIVETCLSLGHRIKEIAQRAEFTKDALSNQHLLTAEFSHLKAIKLGKTVIADGIHMPQFIEFQLADKTVYAESYFKIWFSDIAFRTQYPFYEIRVLSPIANIDDFFDDPIGVAKIKEGISVPELIDKANEKRDESPYTMIKAYGFDWTKDETKISFPWTILVYGGVGENMDIIKDTIAKYILEHSQHPRSDWEAIFPDLFIPTEFVFAPAWSVPSLVASRYITAMNSPTLRVKDLMEFAEEAMPGYSREHLAEHLEVSSSLYNSMGFVVVGNPLNRLAPVSFYEFYPQYALISSRSDDFARMDAKHQDFVSILNKLLVYAQEYDDDKVLPPEIVRVDRNGVVYLAQTHESVQYLVVTRSNYTVGNLNGILINDENLIRNASMRIVGSRLGSVPVMGEVS